MAEEASFSAAQRNVEKFHPAPKHDPVEAGIFGLVVVVGAITVFTTFAGLDVDAFGNAFAVTALVGFLGPFFYFKSEHRKHNSRITAEFLRMSKEEDANRT